ncbi:MAG: hypothetical protein WAM14_24430 [Candidatus Nitrosopolaris sp.]
MLKQVAARSSNLLSLSDKILIYYTKALDIDRKNTVALDNKAEALDNLEKYNESLIYFTTLPKP